MNIPDPDPGDQAPDAAPLVPTGPAALAVPGLALTAAIIERLGGLPPAEQQQRLVQRLADAEAYEAAARSHLAEAEATADTAEQRARSFQDQHREFASAVTPGHCAACGKPLENDTIGEGRAHNTFAVCDEKCAEDLAARGNAASGSLPALDNASASVALARSALDTASASVALARMGQNIEDLRQEVLRCHGAWHEAVREETAAWDALEEARQAKRVATDNDAVLAQRARVQQAQADVAAARHVFRDEAMALDQRLSERVEDTRVAATARRLLARWRMDPQMSRPAARTAAGDFMSMLGDDNSAFAHDVVQEQYDEVLGCFLQIEALDFDLDDERAALDRLTGTDRLARADARYRDAQEGAAKASGALLVAEVAYRDTLETLEMLPRRHCRFCGIALPAGSAELFHIGCRRAGRAAQESDWPGNRCDWCSSYFLHPDAALSLCHWRCALVDPTFDLNSVDWSAVFKPAEPPPDTAKGRRQFFQRQRRAAERFWAERSRRTHEAEATEVTQPRALVSPQPRALPAGPVAGSVANAILELLGSEGPLAAKAIADRLSRPFPSVRDALRRLRELGLVEGGGWRNPWRLK